MSLAGPHVSGRDEVLKFLEDSEYINFIILFKNVQGSKEFKALYQHDVDGLVLKIFGPQSAPETLDIDMVEHYFKYNSSSKEFINLGAKSFSAITDAVCLKKQ